MKPNGPQLSSVGLIGEYNPALGLGFFGAWEASFRGAMDWGLVDMEGPDQIVKLFSVWSACCWIVQIVEQLSERVRQHGACARNSSTGLCRFVFSWLESRFGGTLI